MASDDTQTPPRRGGVWRTGRLSADEALSLFLAAKERDAACGWYHDNVQMLSSCGPCVVRVPRDVPEGRDPEPRMFVETSVLDVVRPYVSFAPGLLFEGGDFSIQEWVPGVPLAQVVEAGEPLPKQALSTLVSLGSLLEGVPWGGVELMGEERRFWEVPVSSSAVFNIQLTRWLSCVYQWCEPLVGAQLRAVGITTNPFAAVALSDDRRPVRLCHGDLTPYNCLWDGLELSVIDWELAVAGDPAYDTASLLHRFSLHEDDEGILLADVLAEVPVTRRGDYMADVAAYRRQEEMRSVVLGTLRACLFTPPKAQ